MIGPVTRRAILFLLSLGFSGVVEAAPQALGIFQTWGAFRDGPRCYAIAEADKPERAEGGRAFASVAWSADRSVRGQAYFRISRPKREGSAVLLRIDDQTFQLRGGGLDAWGADSAADSAIVAAMRTGLQMSVETRAASGALIRDGYRLRGAATAIDAAALGCLSRR
jgi:hypothetical protein